MDIKKSPVLNNTLYHVVGALIVILNSFRHKLHDYKTPRPFSADDISRAVKYDFGITDHLVKHVIDYTQAPDFLKQKVVLELGPGPDLGMALILLSLGVKKYLALDCFELIKATPHKFYEELIEGIHLRTGKDVGDLQKEVECLGGEGSSMIEYHVDKDFNFSSIRDKIDVFLSNASFEHFSDIEKSLRDIDSVAKKGAVLVSVIDLQTHTKLVRERDPLNIYRYSDGFWDSFKFKGSPNRRRTFEYEEVLRHLGWENIVSLPTTVLDLEYVERVRPTLFKRFREMDPTEMRVLNYVLMATKK